MKKNKKGKKKKGKRKKERKKMKTKRKTPSFRFFALFYCDLWLNLLANLGTM
jgi:hypothetical protein